MKNIPNSVKTTDPRIKDALLYALTRALQATQSDLCPVQQIRTQVIADDDYFGELIPNLARGVKCLEELRNAYMVWLGLAMADRLWILEHFRATFTEFLEDCNLPQKSAFFSFLFIEILAPELSKYHARVRLR